MSSSRDLAEQAFVLLRRAIDESEARAAEFSAQLERERPRYAALEHEVASLADRLAQAEEESTQFRDKVAELKESLEEERQQSNRLSDQLQQFEAAVAQGASQSTIETDSLQEEIARHEAAANRSTELLRERELQITELTAALEQQKIESESSKTDAERRLSETIQSKDELIARLEQELAKERDYAENQNELANERAETISSVTEKLEEAQERYEEAKWKLGKAKHFERLVHRRKKLVANLIATIRGKQRANIALKAGVDALRHYKSRAETKQQELLSRIESLENSLYEARERLASQEHDNRATDAPLELSSIDNTQLEREVEAQAKQIAQLEAELEHYRSTQSDDSGSDSDESQDQGVNDTFIGGLTKALSAQRSRGEPLRETNPRLRRVYVSADGDTSSSAATAESPGSKTFPDHDATADNAKDHAAESVQHLSATVREYEETIRQLSEAVDYWKRKHDFLAADTPFGYDSTSTP